MNVTCLFAKQTFLLHRCNTFQAFKTLIRTYTLLTKQWQIETAICLERPPIIPPIISSIEKQYMELKRVEEYEKSVLSDHELRHYDDQAIAEKQNLEDVEGVETARQTAFEMEDSWESELNEYNMAKNEPEEHSSETSIEKNYDKSLILLVKQTVGDKELWLLPRAIWLPGETLRDSADKVLGSVCGENYTSRVLGNAPSSFYDFFYPPSLQAQTGILGCKVFMYKAIYSTTDSCLKDSNVSHMWVTESELKLFLPPRYRNVIKKILFT